MLKFNQIMTFSVGQKSISFTGREAFVLEDKDFQAALVALGVFTVNDDGTMYYSGDISVPMNDGSLKKVDFKGFLVAAKTDLADQKAAGFL